MNKLRRIGPFIVLTCFTVAVFYPFVFHDWNLYWGDVSLYFLPLVTLEKHSLMRGLLPLWNPFISCGQPLVGNPQVWLFYPGTLLLRWMSPAEYLTLNTILHTLIAALGAYLFLRRLCGDRLAAQLGAIVYAGSGFFIARAQFPPMLQAEAWLPWMMLLVDRMIDRPRIWYASLLSLVVTLELLAAHAQIAYMSFACAGIYAIARLMHLHRHRGRAWLAFWRMLTAFLIGILTSSIQLLPTIQLFKWSPRGSMGWLQANRFTLWPRDLVNFILPHYFGNPARGDYWGPGNFWEPCVYVGIIPLFLVGYAIWRSNKRLATRFFAGAALISVWLALGKFGGLFWIAFHIVPGISNFHDPARFAFVSTFALAVLSAIGLRKLRDFGVSANIRYALFIFSAINLVWFSSDINPGVSLSALECKPVALKYLPSPGNGRTFSVLHTLTWHRYVNYDDYGPNTKRYMQNFTDTLTPNFGMRYGWEEANGYEPVPLEESSDVAAATRLAIVDQSPRLASWLYLMDVKFILFPIYTRYPDGDVIPIGEDAKYLSSLKSHLGVSIYVNKETVNPCWLVSHTIRKDTRKDSLAAVLDPHFDPRTTAIVSGGKGIPIAYPESGYIDTKAMYHRGKVIYSAMPKHGEFVCYVDAGTSPKWLVWSSACYPGWKGYVDGKHTPIYRTDYAYLGLKVPPGMHHITFEYKPFIFRFALYLSLIGGLLISMGLGFGAYVKCCGKRWIPYDHTSIY